MILNTVQRWLVGLIVVLLAGCQSAPPPTEDNQSARSIHSGQVIGFQGAHNTHLWRGIPYAQPPVGALRWRAPQPLPAGTGQRLALAYSDSCVQPPLPHTSDRGKLFIGSEDCLYLNVAAPRFSSEQVPQGEDRLPVMVWIHGGGNSVGSASQYSAISNLAGREQVITVNINYRLGIFGWFSHAALRETAADLQDASGNFGTLDTIAALRWVQQNIASFGGDPDNVTVFGESAGGVNVFALLASPQAKGLFHRAIIQSGLPLSFARSQAENYRDAPAAGLVNSSAEIINRLLLDQTIAQDRATAKEIQDSMAPTELVDFLRQQSVAELSSQIAGYDKGLYRAAFVIRDGVVIPREDPITLLSDVTRYNRVPVMLGTNRDELKSLMAGDPDFIDYRLGLLPKVKDPDLYNRVTGYGSAMWKVLGVDVPARAMIDGGNKDVYVYRFDWDEAPSGWLVDLAEYLGAAHSLEIAFVFSDISNEMEYLPFDLFDKVNSVTALPLAEAMSSYWSEFAYVGKPGNGRQQSYAQWLPFVSELGESSNMLLDTGTKGLHMQHLPHSRKNIIDKMQADYELSGEIEELCKTYKKLFWDKEFFRFRWSDAEYQGLVEGGCPPLQP